MGFCKIMRLQHAEGPIQSSSGQAPLDSADGTPAPPRRNGSVPPSPKIFFFESRLRLIHLMKLHGETTRFIARDVGISQSRVVGLLKRAVRLVEPRRVDVNVLGL